MGSKTPDRRHPAKAMKQSGAMRFVAGVTVAVCLSRYLKRGHGVVAFLELGTRALRPVSGGRRWRRREPRGGG